jgi:hypothetical protein
MGGMMAELSHDNTRLAARLRSFADVVDPPAKGNGGMTPEDHAALPEIRETPATLGHVLLAFRELAREFKRLEREIAELKAKMLTDGGVWHAETFYEKAAVVTYQGAPWIANEPNSNAKPGTSSVWRLIGKSHR